MKKIGITIISFVFSAVLISSCATKHNGPFLSASPGSPSISAPSSGATYVLDKAKASDTLTTVKWSAPNYGYPAAVTYTIQMDKQGDNFANPMKLGTSNLTSFSITEGNMNTFMLGNGFAFGQPTTLEMRVMASISDSIKAEVSSPISVVITPYSSYTYIYMPGNYQAYSGYGSGWTPKDAPPIAMVGPQKFEGYVYVNDQTDSDIEFKFTKDQSWDTAYGIGSSAGTLSTSGGNITMPTSGSGYYLIKVDLNALTYTMAKTAWGIIGDATPGAWKTDTPMTYDPTNKVWTVTTTLDASGTFKFRANDSWDINYGYDGDGKLTFNGNNNIPVATSGTYKIILDLSNPPLYTYKLIKQ